jgi:HSP20 family protein
MTNLIRRFDLDQFDLLWRDLFESNSNFANISHRITHPVDIYETDNGIQFEIAAVGLDKQDIEILVEGEQLRIKYEKSKEDDRSPIYKGIKRSAFDISWKISTKFDLSKLQASLDKGLLVLNVPIAEGKAVKRIELK